MTAALYRRLERELVLRQGLSALYATDLRSASEPQIAEMVLTVEYQRRTGVSRRMLQEMARTGRPRQVQFVPPAWAEQIQDPGLRSWLDLRLRTPVAIDQDGRLQRVDLATDLAIGDRWYRTGVGGLHSVDGAGTWWSSTTHQLVDLDVASYYPAILLNHGLRPAHTKPVFSEIYRDIVERRLAAKRSGDRTTADGLKIVANSVYGKLGEPHSAFYDPQAQLQVVLTGQLALLWLIAQIEAAEHTVVSANTDGVTVRMERSRGHALTAVVDAWQAATGFTLERTDYARLVQKDVNNYLAVKEDGGLKRKGIFVDGLDLRVSPKPGVIPRAVAASLLDHAPVERTVRDSTDLHDFLYAIVLRNAHGRHGEQALGKVLRWYRSTRAEAPALMRVPLEAGQPSRVPDGERAALALDLPDRLPEDLDREHYAAEAEALLKRVRFPKQPGMNRAAGGLAERGLSPYPLWGGKKTPPGETLTKVFRHNETDFTSYPNLGTQTGPKVGVLVLDLDHPERLPDGLRALLPTTMACQAVSEGVEADFAGVCASRIRGKLLLRYKGELPATKSEPQALEQFGLEVFYGQVCAVWGPRPDGKRYLLSDEPLAEAPEALVEWLRVHAFKMRAHGSRSAPQGGAEGTDAGAAPDGAAQRLQQLQTLEPELAGLGFQEAAWGGRPGLVGRCPGPHKAHSDRRELLVGLTATGSLFVHCVHATCPWCKAHAERLRAVFDGLEAEPEPDPEPAPHSPPGEPPSRVLEALRRPVRDLLVLAGTGAGKSHDAALYLIEELEAGHPVVYVAANKKDLRQMEQALLQLSSAGSLAALGVGILWRDVIDSGEEEEQPEASGRRNRAPDLRTLKGLLTHRSYLLRRGDASLWHSLYRQIAAARIEVIFLVDEADALLEACLRNVALDARYRRSRRKGAAEDHFERLEKCPAFHRFGSCATCVRYENALAHRVGAHHQLELHTPARPDPATPGVDPGPLLPAGEPVYWGEACWQPIETHGAYLDAMPVDRVLHDGEIYDPNVELRARIETAWRPRVVTHHPTRAGVPMDPEDVPVDAKERAQQGIRFPAQPCGVRVLQLADLAPLRLLARYSMKLRLLTATLTPGQEAFLRAGLGRDLVIEHVEPRERRMASVEVFVMPKAWTFWRNRADLKRVTAATRSLVVLPTKTDAEQFRQYHADGEVALFREGVTEMVLGHQDRPQAVRMLVTYARSALGRAMNLGQYRAVLVDARLFKPGVGTLAAEPTEEAVRRAVEGERETLITQVVGRILRPDGEGDDLRRLVVLTGLPTDAEGRPRPTDRIVEAIQKRADAPVRVTRFEDPKSLLAATEAWARGEAVPTPEPAAESQPRPVRRMGRTERGRTAHTRADDTRTARQNRRAQAYRQVLDQLEQLRAQGMRWADAVRRVNLARYIAGPERKRLRELYLKDKPLI